MNFIDKKGRIFGKINIVDFFIVAFIIVIIPLFFLMYEILGKTPVKVPHHWVRIRVVTFALPEMIELFKPGDVTLDENGVPDGRLIRIIEKDYEYGNRLKSAMIKKGDMENDYRVPVVLEIEISCTRNSRNEKWYYRRLPITIGLNCSIVFSTVKYETGCYIVGIEDK